VIDAEPYVPDNEQTRTMDPSRRGLKPRWTMAEESPFTSEEIASIHAMAERQANEETREIERAIEEGDRTVYLVLRLHLLSEQLLDRFLNLKLARADRLRRLGYAHGLALVRAFDVLDEAALEVFARVNALRNRIAHDRAATITPAAADKIGQPLGLCIYS
jgi:hypothetical protein